MAKTDGWYEFLKEYRNRLNNCEHPAECYEELYKEAESRYQQEKQSGFYTREEAWAKEELLKALRENAPVAEGSKEETALVFAEVKTGFDETRELLEQLEQETKTAVEYAFDFMEQAFPDGQEMVVFVNELALGPDSAPFLAENECERFEQYSSKLLLHGGEDELLAELQRDDIRAGEHSAEF